MRRLDCLGKIPVEIAPLRVIGLRNSPDRGDPSDFTVECPVVTPRYALIRGKKQQDCDAPPFVASTVSSLVHVSIWWELVRERVPQLALTNQSFAPGPCGSPPGTETSLLPRLLIPLGDEPASDRQMPAQVLQRRKRIWARTVIVSSDHVKIISQADRQRSVNENTRPNR